MDEKLLRSYYDACIRNDIPFDHDQASIMIKKANEIILEYSCLKMLLSGEFELEAFSEEDGFKYTSKGMTAAHTLLTQ